MQFNLNNSIIFYTNTPDNSPFNQPVLNALESVTRVSTPQEVADQILCSQPSDDLSGLRVLARQLKKPDYWCDEIDLTEPKRQIAEYVEAAGIPVPARYKSIHHAMEVVALGGTIIARSEHPDEYDGPSGLFDSHVINTKRIHPKLTGLNRNLALVDNPTLALTDTIYEDIEYRPGVQRYVNLTGQSINEYGDGLEYTFWEYVPGTNIKVVADDAVPGQYHIVMSGSTTAGHMGRLGSGYIAKRDGEIVRERGLDDGNSPELLASIINQYEAVRTLPAFSDAERPIMEFQRDEDGVIQFLQYHKSRPYQPTELKLDSKNYPKVEGWIAAQAVRGAVGEQLTLNAAVFYPEKYGESISGYRLQPAEDASFNMTYDVGLTEAVARERIVSLLPVNFGGIYNGLACNHERSSNWFKPRSSIALGGQGYKDLIPPELKKEVSDQVHEHGRMARVAIDVASDGQQAFVRLSPSTDQPVYQSH